MALRHDDIFDVVVTCLDGNANPTDESWRTVKIRIGKVEDEEEEEEKRVVGEREEAEEVEEGDGRAGGRGGEGGPGESQMDEGKASHAREEVAETSGGRDEGGERGGGEGGRRSHGRKSKTGEENLEMRAKPDWEISSRNEKLRLSPTGRNSCSSNQKQRGIGVK